MMYLGQIANILELLNGGVTTMLDYLYHMWSNEIAFVGL